MKKKLFLGTHNRAKIERFKNLLSATGLEFEIYTPEDLNLKNVETQETGKTLAENAELKARAYFGKVDMPILANDAGFWVEGEGLVDAPKRIALGKTDEKSLTEEELANAQLEFWRNVARRHGGRVNAAWVDLFVLLNPDGEVKITESKREVVLTETEFGKAHIHMPVRALYISKATNKPAIQHTKEEEFLELKPVTDALSRLLS